MDEHRRQIASTDRGLQVDRAVVPIAALLFAAGIAIADALTQTALGLAALYAPLPLLGAAFGRRRWVLGIGAASFALTLITFFATQGAMATGPAIARQAVALVAVAIVTLLAMREASARAAATGTRAALEHADWRYRSIFKNGAFPIWEQDFSRLLARLADLRSEGVTDLVDYAGEHPAFSKEMAELILTTDVNDALITLLGAKSRDAALGAVRSLLPNDVEGIDPRGLQLLFDGATQFVRLENIVTVDGTQKAVVIASALIQDGERAGSYVGTMIDVTEQEKAHQALAAAQAELARASRVATVGALSASIAHELNQPLGAAIMNVQTSLRYLRRETPDLEAAIRAAERAVHEGNRASRIVQETRELVTKRRSQEEVVDLGVLVRDVLGLLTREIAASGAKVEIDSPTEAPRLIGDPTALQQVLVNLIGNALQAMSHTPIGLRKVEIFVAAEGPDGVIRVRDYGPGIAAENLERVFDSFFTTKDGGMGMGLAISRDAIEAGEGSLKASNHESGGAVFECRLPLQRAAVAL